MAGGDRQQRSIGSSGRVQRDDVRYRKEPFVAADPLDRIAWTCVAFAHDCAIEAAAAALREALHDVGSPKTDCQLVAGDTRLRDDQLSRTDPIAIADSNVFLAQPFRGEVFTERAPGQSVPGSSRRHAT